MAPIIGHWQRMLKRLEGGEPIRLLIGDRLYDAGEIVLTPKFQAELRRNLIGELASRVAGEDAAPDSQAISEPALPGADTSPLVGEVGAPGALARRPGAPGEGCRALSEQGANSPPALDPSPRPASRPQAAGAGLSSPTRGEEAL